MKTLSLLFFVLLLAGNANSQAPGLTGTVAANLQSIQASNKALIDRQQKTLDLLDQLIESSAQLKYFGKRT